MKKIWRPEVYQCTVLKVSGQPRHPAESTPYFSDPSGRWACPLCLTAVLLVPHPSPLIHYSSVSLSPNEEHHNAPNISECCAMLNCTGRVGVRVTEEDHDQVSYCAKKWLLHRKQTLGYPAWPDSNDVLFATVLLRP